MSVSPLNDPVSVTLLGGPHDGLQFQVERGANNLLFKIDGQPNHSHCYLIDYQPSGKVKGFYSGVATTEVVLKPNLRREYR